MGSKSLDQALYGAAARGRTIRGQTRTSRPRQGRDAAYSE